MRTFRLRKECFGFPRGKAMSEYLGNTFGLVDGTTALQSFPHVAVCEVPDKLPFYVIPLVQLTEVTPGAPSSG